MADIIIEQKARKEYEKPAVGMHQSVLAEIQDLGLQTVTYNGETKQVHQVRFYWQFGTKDKEGYPISLLETFTKSLSDKAKLRTRIKDMFGKEPPQTLNLSKLVGTNVQMLVDYVQGKKDPSRTYAVVKAILKADPSKPKLEPLARPKKDEAKAAPTASVAGTAVTEASPISDEDIPF